MNVRTIIAGALALYSPINITETPGPFLLRRAWCGSILLMILTVLLGRYMYEKGSPEWMLGFVFYPYSALIIYMAVFICVGTWKTTMQWQHKFLAFATFCSLLPLQLFLLLALWVATMMGISDAPRTMK